MKRSPIVATLLVAALAIACAKHSSRDSRPGDDPHDTDSLYKLLRRSLVDSDPYLAMEQFACESMRLTERLGMDESDRRIRALLDTVYPTVHDRHMSVEVDKKLDGHNFPLDDANCGPGFEGHYEPDSTPPAIAPPKTKHPPQ